MIDIHQTDSILFDMDGTLWDGVESYAQGFNDFFKSKNIEKRITADELYGLMGMEEERLVNQTLSEFPADERKEMYRNVVNFQYEHVRTNGGVLYPFVKVGLKILSQKYKLFIVSNCAEFMIKYFMEWAGIGKYITDSMAHGANLKSKSVNIKSLISQYSLKGAVYVGDTDSDSAQCELAFIPFVFVSYGFGDTDRYEMKFDSFAELTGYFDKK